MSVRVMSWVWEHSKSVGADRLVLLAIADCANDAGRDAYPSMETIARKAAVDKRTAQRSVRDLEALGELEVLTNAGPRGTNRYAVLTSLPRQDTTPGDTPDGETPPRRDATPAPRHGGDRSQKGRRHATRTVLNVIPPQPPASGGTTTKEWPCKNHTKPRKGCRQCAAVMADTEARERARTAALFAEIEESKSRSVTRAQALGSSGVVA